MPKRGEIYLHLEYKYPLGNVDDKYIVILNDTTSKQNSVIILPATKCKSLSSFQRGCGKTKREFSLEANEDFFPLKTILKFFPLNNTNTSMLSQADFDRLVTEERIKYRGCLNKNTFDQIIACIKYHEMDVDLEIMKIIRN